MLPGDWWSSRWRAVHFAEGGSPKSQDWVTRGSRGNPANMP